MVEIGEGSSPISLFSLKFLLLHFYTFPCIPHAVLKAEALIAGHCSSKGPDRFCQRKCTKNDYDLNQKFQNQEKNNYVSEVQEPILQCTQNTLH